MTEQPTTEQPRPDVEPEVNVEVVRLIATVLDEVLDERSFVHCTSEDFARAMERSLAAAGRLLPEGASPEVADLVEVLNQARAAFDQLMTQHLAMRNALADCVVKATEYGVQDGDFVASYILPTGPLHRAIPLLAGENVHVRPGFDGRWPPVPINEESTDGR